MLDTVCFRAQNNSERDSSGHDLGKLTGSLIIQNSHLHSRTATALERTMRLNHKKLQFLQVKMVKYEKLPG